MRKKLPDKEFRWTPNLAYAIGLLATDGNLSPDGRHLTLVSSDKSLLKTFRECLKLHNKISETFNNGYAKKRIYRITFGNVQFYRWLVKLGIGPAKSHTIGIVNIPPHVLRDFLRGHLDGDGTIYYYEDKYNKYKGKIYTNTRVYTKFISSSENHIRWLQEMLKKYSPVGTGSLTTNNNMWEIKFSKYKSLELFQWIYYKENIPCLKRKRDIADFLLKNTNNYKLVRLPNI